MPLYKSQSEKPSGVTSYKAGEDFIEIQFDGWLYTYSYLSAGRKAVEEMKNRAAANEGLSRFVSRHDPGFKKKETLY
jgi:hypothetical protein